MPGVLCCTQTAVLHAVQATDKAILSLFLCFHCVDSAIQMSDFENHLCLYSLGLCSVSVHVMCKCLGEGSINAAHFWVACMSHRADGWLGLLRPGC